MGFNSQQWAKLGNKKPSQLDFHFTFSQRPPFRSINYVLVQPQVRLRGWEDEISDNDGSKKGFLLQAMRKKEYHWRFGQVWMPDTFFRNEKSGHFHNILVNNVYIRCNISKLQSVTYSKSLLLKPRSFLPNLPTTNNNLAGYSQMAMCCTVSGGGALACLPAILHTLHHSSKLDKISSIFPLAAPKTHFENVWTSERKIWVGDDNISGSRSPSPARWTWSSTQWTGRLARSR